MLTALVYQHARPCLYCRFEVRKFVLRSQRLRNRSTKVNSRGFLDHYFERKGLSSINESKDAPSKFRKHVLGRNTFNDVFDARLEELKVGLAKAPILQQLRKENKTSNPKALEFEPLWQEFVRKITTGHSAEGRSHGRENSGRGVKSLRAKLEETYHPSRAHTLDAAIKSAFYAHLFDLQFSEADVQSQRTLADLRYPSEWYPATRLAQRQIHMHVGPTNSGKTYQALRRLEQAETGIYAGPLRLLAHEVYSRMNAKGIACSLITGEERRAAPTGDRKGLGSLSSCTVEMLPLNTSFSVAVIDEIQMLGDSDRGWAWTQALMGVKAREVHLCGEERAVPLVTGICASLGETLTIHRYKRLSPLRIEGESLNGDLRKLRKGDCVVSFSVMGIHALRSQIEKKTGKKVAIVYGSLPPETRAQQARLFNDPDNDYDYLVASDAVGMGLNLAIKRVIFESASKFDGFNLRVLSVAEIKQIAGRAGRYRVAVHKADTPESGQNLAATEEKPSEPAAAVQENIGLVTTLESFDYPVVAAALEEDPAPMRTAGICPPISILERFAAYFPPRTPFSYILTRLAELSRVHSRFHLCRLKEQLLLADAIEHIEGLSIADRNIICAAPLTGGTDELWHKLLPAYARHIAEQEECNIIDVEELPLEILDVPFSTSKEYLRDLERLHKGVVAYLWLSYRFAGIFTTRAVAFHVKSLVEAKIEEVLGGFNFSEKRRRLLAARRAKMLQDEIETSLTAENSDENASTALASELASSDIEEVLSLREPVLEPMKLDDNNMDQSNASNGEQTRQIGEA